MMRENVLVGKHQFKLSLMFMNLLWKYAVMLILQKWKVELWVITVYKAIYFAPYPLWLFMCCHWCKPKKTLIRKDIRKSQLNSITFIFFLSKTFNIVSRNKKFFSHISIRFCRFAETYQATCMVSTKNLINLKCHT